MSAPYGPKQPILYQPVASQGMVVNPKNSLNKPDIEGKGREWSSDLCACTSAVWHGAYLVSYTALIESVSATSNAMARPIPITEAHVTVIASSMASSLGVSIGNRGHIRSRYGIKGGGCTDCLTSCFCSPCALTQEEAEIELEEKALTQQQGGYYQKA
ncbi:hypothetical protein J132_02455 [Termitomyces sp. J132]|nr:hypothetical protein J132_02455 [Termitomyces sp. J132]